jgi:hypothetical protein
MMTGRPTGAGADQAPRCNLVEESLGLTLRGQKLRNALFFRSVY